MKQLEWMDCIGQPQQPPREEEEEGIQRIFHMNHQSCIQSQRASPLRNVKFPPAAAIKSTTTKTNQVRFLSCIWCWHDVADDDGGVITRAPGQANSA